MSVCECVLVMYVPQKFIRTRIHSFPPEATPINKTLRRHKHTEITSSESESKSNKEGLNKRIACREHNEDVDLSVRITWYSAYPASDRAVLISDLHQLLTEFRVNYVRARLSRAKQMLKKDLTLCEDITKLSPRATLMVSLSECLICVEIQRILGVAAREI